MEKEDAVACLRSYHHRGLLLEETPTFWDLFEACSRRYQDRSLQVSLSFSDFFSVFRYLLDDVNVSNSRDLSVHFQSNIQRNFFTFYERTLMLQHFMTFRSLIFPQILPDYCKKKKTKNKRENGGNNSQHFAEFDRIRALATFQFSCILPSLRGFRDRERVLGCSGRCERRQFDLAPGGQR